jgi:predicted MFS family arabinose efflux permease
VASVLRSNKSLRRLLGAWLQSCLGTGVGYVALLLLTVRYWDTPWALTAVLLADFLPAIAFGAVFGALADRLSRRRLIVAANLLQAGAWGGLAFAHAAPEILSLALLAGVGNALQRPAMRAALPVVAGEARQAAAAWNDTCRWIGITVGPLFAAGLLVITGVGVPLALNGASFLIAAAVIATLSLDGDASEPPEQKQSPGFGLRSGLSVAFAAPGIAAVMGCSAAVVISFGLFNVCEPLLATKVLHGSGSDYALLVAANGIGMVVGSALVAHRGNVGADAIIRRYIISLVLFGLAVGSAAIVGSIAAAALAFTAIGYANALLLVSETQLIQLRVPNAVQGRLFGVKDTIEGVFFLVGLVGAGALVDAAGVRVALATAACFYALCTLAAVATLRPRHSQAAARAASAAEPDAAALGLEPAFRALTPAAPARRRFDPDAALALASRDDGGAQIDERAPIPVARPGG